MMRPVILQQIVMNLSILAAVVPGLHSFIANLTAGSGFGVEVRESTNEASNPSYGKSTPRNNASAPRHSSHPHHTHERRSRLPNVGLRADKAYRSNAWAALREEANEWEDSDRRSDGSQDNIIRRTVTWQVSMNGSVSSMPREEGEVQTSPLDGEVREARAKNFGV